MTTNWRRIIPNALVTGSVNPGSIERGRGPFPIDGEFSVSCISNGFSPGGINGGRRLAGSTLQKQIYAASGAEQANRLDLLNLNINRS